MSKIMCGTQAGCLRALAGTRGANEEEALLHGIQRLVGKGLWLSDLLAHEAFVALREQVGLHLLGRVDRDTDEDQQ